MPENQGHGLMQSLGTLASTVLGIVQTRLEILVTEIEEERIRLEQLLLIGALALISLGLGVLLLTVFIVVAFWDHRLLMLGILTVLFFSVGIVSALAFRNRSRQASPLFSASVAELAKDRELLSPRP
ncbi:MAG: phage holin family protein [Burkholderiales bacterium]|nr:phage holin family protein [Sulfuricellaceae bacterium]